MPDEEILIEMGSNEMGTMVFSHFYNYKFLETAHKFQKKGYGDCSVFA